ncbi:hypothetical protein JCM3774_001937 [Rhodotorula dairenensis]
MSGSRTAIPIRAPSPKPHSPEKDEPDVAGLETSREANLSENKWWTSEDLEPRKGNHSDAARVDSGGGTFETFSGSVPSTSTPGQHTLGRSPARLSLSPTASLFQPSRFRMPTTAAAASPSIFHSPTDRPGDTRSEGGFLPDTDEANGPPSSPEVFLYPGPSATQLGTADPHACRVETAGSVSSVGTVSSLLSVEEKAEIVALTMSSFSRASKAVAIKRPSDGDQLSQSTQRDHQSTGGISPGPARPGGGYGFRFSSPVAEFRPRSSAGTSTASSRGRVTPVLRTGDDQSFSSPACHSHSPTSFSFSSSRRSGTSPSVSLVPYDLSSDEEEYSTAYAPSSTTSRAEEGGGGVGPDSYTSATPTPSSDAVSQGASLGRERSALDSERSSTRPHADKHAHPLMTQSPPEKNLSTAETAHERIPPSVKLERSPLSAEVTPDTSLSVEGDESVHLTKNGRGVMENQTPDAEPVGLAIEEALAATDAETGETITSERDPAELARIPETAASRGTNHQPAAPVASNVGSNARADTPRNEPVSPPPALSASAAELEMIRSEAVVRAEQARSGLGDDSEAVWNDMPPFHLDRRGSEGSTSFNPFAAPFVPPALPAQSVSQQPPPSENAPGSGGFGYAFQPLQPVMVPAPQPFAPAEVRYQTTVDLLRQALQENGVLHYKVLKYDQVHKVDHDRLRRLTQEVEDLRAQKARIRNEPRLDPLQQKQLMDLQQTVARQSSDLTRLRVDLEAARSVALQANNARLAGTKRHEENLAHENGRWKVALEMRDERIKVLKTQVASSGDMLTEVKAELATAAAALVDAKAENAQPSEMDALAAVRQQLSKSEQALGELQARTDRAEANVAKASAELRESIGQCDELRGKLADVEKERDNHQGHQADSERLRAECADLQRRCEGQKDMIETQSKNLKEAVAQQEALKAKLASAEGQVAAAKVEEQKIRSARDHLVSILRSTHQDKEESERKYRAELDKVQRELASVSKDLHEAVREIVLVEDERDGADLVAADSFEYACAGLQSLRRLYEAEQHHTKQLQDDYSILKSTCMAQIKKLEQELKEKEAEVATARRDAQDPARAETLTETQRKLAITERERDEAVRAHRQAVSEHKAAVDELKSTQKDRDENRKARADLQAGLKRMIELRDTYKAGETRAQEEVGVLKEQLKHLEQRRSALEEALDEAKSARDESVRILTDTMADAKRSENDKSDSEEKVRLLEEKVASLEADLDKAKAGVMAGSRPYTFRTMSLVRAAGC